MSGGPDAPSGRRTALVPHIRTLAGRVTRRRPRYVSRMKPRVLALDFDGTIAVNDTMDVDVAAAIQEARAAGLLVVLVTGRSLSDLDALFSSPPQFDAIVAENGAVLRLPKLPSPITLSQGPDLRFWQSSDGAGSRISVVSVWWMLPLTLHRRSLRSSGLSVSLSLSPSMSAGSWCCRTASARPAGFRKRSGACAHQCTTPLPSETRRTITSCSKHARSVLPSHGAAKR